MFGKRRFCTVCLSLAVAVLSPPPEAAQAAEQPLSPPPVKSSLTEAAPAAQSPVPLGGRLLQCSFYERTAFEKSVQMALAYPMQGRLVAGVVPHHLLAGEMIASFFAAAAQQQAYDTVVFAAPSHYPTQDWVVTTLSDWQTPYGIVENDETLTKKLMKNRTLAARVDDENMQLDHAVTGLIPYVKYYLPQARVSAVLLPGRTVQSRANALADALLDISQNGGNILLVCSIDFSHYLMPDEAAVRDAQTRQAVGSFNYPVIAGFTDSNVDSPRALSVFLRYTQGMGVDTVSFLDSGSSDKILGLSLSDPLYRDGITTYFILGALADNT